MWLILGLLSGFSYGLTNAIAKRTLKEVSPALVSFGWTAFSLPYLLGMLVWLKFSPTNFTFWWATLVSAGLNVIGFLLLMRALKTGDLSLTVPFLSFTPLFLILISWLMLGEFPTILGIFGILGVVAGAYLIGLTKEGGILAPIKILLRSREVQLVMVVAAIYAVISVLNKIAVLNSSPLTYLIFYQAIAALLLLPIIQFGSIQKLGALRVYFRPLILIGLLEALTLICQMNVLILTLVPYAISLKRTSTLWSIIWGGVFFKEKNIKTRLSGALIMVLGVIFISLG